MPLIEQEVVENLLQFKEDPYSIPSSMVLSTGVITIQDQFTGTWKLPYSDTGGNAKEADLGGSRQFQEAWTITPVTDPADILSLQYVYGTAVLHASKGAKSRADNAQERALSIFSFRGTLSTSANEPPKVGNCKSSSPGSQARSNPPPSFQDCAQIENLLDSAATWLSFRKKRGFVREDGFPGDHVWVKPLQFSRFVMVVLNATPTTTAAAQAAKPIAFAVQ
ncbi:MAG: hypothetical protein ACREDL_17800 [Bradyrhizobium sp.]